MPASFMALTSSFAFSVGIPCWIFTICLAAPPRADSIFSGLKFNEDILRQDFCGLTYNNDFLKLDYSGIGVDKAELGSFILIITRINV